MKLSGFLKAFSRWKRNLEELDLSLAGEKKSQAIARFISKLILVRMLSQLEAIKPDFLRVTFMKARDEGNASGLKTCFSKINKVITDLLGNENYFTPRNGETLVDVIRDPGKNVPEFLQKVGLLINLDPEISRKHPNINDIDFLSIDEDLLGIIHEKFHVTRKRKAGIYYTPRSIASYIIKETARCYGLKEVSSIKLLDPACGSGVFLVEALKFFLEGHEMTKARCKDTPDLCIKIVENQLHGVDLDVDALKLARTNLIVEIIKLTGPSRGTGFVEKLACLDANLTHGNSLIGFNEEMTIDVMNKLPSKESVKEEINKQFTKFLEDQGFSLDLQQFPPVHFPVEFPRMFFDGSGQPLGREFRGFDMIVGNPPYLGYKQYLDTHDRKYLEWRFKIFTGQSDMYYYFFELHQELLKKEGASGQVTSRYFLQGTHAENLRRMLNNQQIVKIVDFDENQVFAGVGIHALVFIFKKLPAPTDHNVVLVKLPPNTLGQGVLLDSIEGTGTSTSLVPQASLDDRCWSFLSREGLEIKKKFEGFDSLGDIGTCISGSETGLDKAFVNDIIQENGRHYGVYKGKKTLLEGELIHPWVKNRDIEKYSHAASGYCIYVPPGMTEDILEDEFPGVHAHLSNHRVALKSRDGGKIKVPWYIWRRPKNVKNMVRVPKLICPYKASTLRFSIDREKTLSSYDVTVFVLENREYDIHYVLGLLNSKPVEWYFKTYGKKMGDIYEVYSGPLSSIKIPRPRDTRSSRTLMELVDKALHLKKAGMSKELEETIMKIDAVAFHLFSLSIDDAGYILDRLGMGKKEKDGIISELNSFVEIK
ncbi:MAG: Eco57I restriction-modification methylase domain-containing protein [Candidatus Hodarchaeota archaeon]